MEQLAPVIQTLLWVLVVGAVLWRFHASLQGLLTAIQRRIEAGSGVKAGFFELAEFRPQDEAEQREKARAEVAESELALEVEETSQKRGTKQPARRQLEEVNLNQSSTASRLGERVLIAEDLALRAIQAEFGVTLMRHVSSGQGISFDAVFRK